MLVVIGVRNTVVAGGTIVIAGIVITGRAVTTGTVITGVNGVLDATGEIAITGRIVALGATGKLAAIAGAAGAIAIAGDALGIPAGLEAATCDVVGTIAAGACIPVEATTCCAIANCEADGMLVILIFCSNGVAEGEFAPGAGAIPVCAGCAGGDDKIRLPNQSSPNSFPTSS